MNARLGWFGAACLFTTAASLIWAGHPLVAAVLLMGVSYLAGRWDRRRDRQAESAKVERLQAENTGLRDELIYHYDQQHIALFGDVSRMLPDLGDRTDWASLDRKPDTAAPHMPVSERTTTHP